MSIDIDMKASLYHFRLGLIQRENHLYSLYDLDTGDWYEKMTLFYIQSLLRTWTHHRSKTNDI